MWLWVNFVNWVIFLRFELVIYVDLIDAKQHFGFLFRKLAPWFDLYMTAAWRIDFMDLQ